MHTPILLLHGALGTAAQFNNLLPLFPSEQAVFAVTFPGHGDNPASGPYSMSSFADAVLAFMDKANIARADIFGYSMGGYIALYLAAQHPERIRRVVTYGTKLDWTPAVAADMNRMFDPEKIEAKVPQFAQALNAAHADWKAVCRHTAAFLQDLGDGKGIPEAAFAKIACHISIGRGSADHVVSEAESRKVAEAIPHGKYVELPEQKHQLELVDSNVLFKFVEERRTIDD